MRPLELALYLLKVPRVAGTTRLYQTHSEHCGYLSMVLLASCLPSLCLIPPSLSKCPGDWQSTPAEEVFFLTKAALLPLPGAFTLSLDYDCHFPTSASPSRSSTVKWHHDITLLTPTPKRCFQHFLFHNVRNKIILIYVAVMPHWIPLLVVLVRIEAQNYGMSTHEIY